jgi:hypothetical protein
LWNDDIKLAAQVNKKAVWEWKSAGKPSSPTNPLTMTKKEATKKLRSEQRILAAKLRDREL